MITVPYEGKLGGLTNMARDRCLLSLAESGAVVARVYEWDRPWVSLGQFQKVADALLPSSAIAWVRRPTGGRAVLHGHDVTVGLAMPVEAGRGVRSIYPEVIGLLAAALREAGAEAVLGRDLIGERGGAVRSADCFASVSPNDIVHPESGQKVCGCAMRLSESGVLVQASIPAAVPSVDVHEVYASPAPVSWTRLDPLGLAAALQQVLNKNSGWDSSRSSGSRAFG